MTKKSLETAAIPVLGRIAAAEEPGHGGSLCDTPPRDDKNDCKSCINYVTYTHFVELTLCYPHTTKFLNMFSNEQKKMYDIMFHKMKNIPVPPVIVEGHCEYFASGQVHFHAILYYNITNKFFPIGFISDLTRAWLKQLPKKYANFNTKCLNVHFNSYKCPSIKVEIKPYDVEREQTWLTYIRKNMSK